MNRRHAAAKLEIDVIGTLRILADAKRLGHIDAVRPVIAQMQSKGHRFDRALIRRFLERINET
jgi:predicted nucleic acid-binding protein